MKKKEEKQERKKRRENWAVQGQDSPIRITYIAEDYYDTRRLDRIQRDSAC